MQETQDVWKIYHNQLLGFISSKVSDKDMAKDILHDVFVKIHTNLEKVEDAKRLRSWIYTITRNTIIDYYRKQNIKTDVPLWLEDDDLNVDEQVQEELSLCLGYLITRLPEKYKAAIQISEIEGKSQQELADYEKITLSGAKSRVQRGRKLLKEMILKCCEVELDARERVVDYSIRDEENCELLQGNTNQSHDE